MNRLLLNKATSSSDEPTPGYIYNEIYQMTFYSKESLTVVGDFLIKKLQRADLNVKLKSLKVLRHLCDNTRLDIRNYLKKKIDIIKECQNCNIVNDELKGETPSILVRKEATELLKMIYSYDNIENTGKPNVNETGGMTKDRIVGFGNVVYDKNKAYLHSQKTTLPFNAKNVNASRGWNRGAEQNLVPNSVNRINSLTNVMGRDDAYSFERSKQLHHSTSAMNLSSSRNVPPSINTISSGKMTGIGNPHFNQYPLPKTKKEIAIKYINEIATKYIPSTFVNKLEKVSDQISKNYSNGSLNLQNIININGYNGHTKSTAPVKNKKYAHENRITAHSNATKNTSKKIGNKARISESAGTYERKVVEDVLNTAGAIKKVPNETMLLEFAQKCEVLDTKLIVSILTEKLEKNFINEEENWKHKYKVLCVIEYLLLHKKKKEKGKTVETLESLTHNLKYQTLEELYRCTNLKQLKKKVNEIFVLLGLRQKTDITEEKKEKRKVASTVKELSEEAQKQTTHIEIPDLLDIDDANEIRTNKEGDLKGKTENDFTFMLNTESNKKSVNSSLNVIEDMNAAGYGKFNEKKEKHIDKNINSYNNRIRGNTNEESNKMTNDKKDCDDFFSYNPQPISDVVSSTNSELFSSLQVKNVLLKNDNKKNLSDNLNGLYDLSHLNSSFGGGNDLLNDAHNENQNSCNLIFMDEQEHTGNPQNTNLSTLTFDRNKRSDTSSNDLNFLSFSNENFVENTNAHISDKRDQKDSMHNFTLI